MGQVCNSYSGWLKEVKFLCAKIKEYGGLGLLVNLGLKKRLGVVQADRWIVVSVAPDF